VGVRAAHQGTGLGRALYEHFAGVARERGLHPPAGGHGPVQHRLAGVPRRDGLRGDRAITNVGGPADLPRLPRPWGRRNHLLQATHLGAIASPCSPASGRETRASAASR
jgi:GNAT superfamily N-acetyltransferase